MKCLAPTGMPMAMSFGNSVVKRILVLLVMLFVVSGTVGYTDAFAADGDRYFLYVAVDGQDNAAGTMDAPLATIAGARDKIRILKAQGVSPQKGFIVYFRGGEYSNKESTVFTEEDSGSETAPIIYRAYPGEEVVLVGGVSINGSDFKPITESIRKRIIDPAAADKIMTINLKEQGFQEFEKPYLYGTYSYYFGRDIDASDFLAEGYEQPTAQAPEFYLGDTPLSVAKYPNSGFLNVEKVINPGWDVDGNFSDKKNPTAPGTPFEIKVTDARMEHYEQATQPILYGFFRYDWADASVPVSYDKKSGTIKSAWSATYGIDPDKPVYFYNLLEEIDVPGEYYLETETGDLYIYPPSEMAGKTVRMSYVKEPLFELKDVKNIQFKGFGISVTRGRAIEVTDSYNNVFSDLDISYTGENAISITRGGNNIVKNSYIHEVNGGVVLNGDVENLIDTKNQVVNNHFENYARIKKTYNGAISMYGVNDYAAYNEIHGADHLAIQFAGADNKIYYNHIYDVVNNSDDAGAIYGGQTWVTGRGLEIKYNYIHDVPVKPDMRYGNGAIYLDGGQCEVTMAGNVVEDCYRAFWVNGGWDCIVYNNISINSTSYFTTAALAYTNSRDSYYAGIRDPKYMTDVWNERFPLLVKMRQQENNWILPVNNYYGNNVVVGGENEDIEHREADTLLKRGTNYVTKEDPGFYNMAEKNFLLKEDSVVFEKLPEFVAPPFTRMGTNYERAKERVKEAVVLVLESPKSFKDGELTHVDENNHAVTPKLIGDYTYVPLRFIAEALGAEVGFDPATRKVSVSNATRSLELTIDSKEAMVNGTAHTMENTAIIDGDRTLVPLREVANLLDKSVYWNDIGLIAVSGNPQLFDEEKNSDDDIITYLFDQLTVY